MGFPTRLAAPVAKAILPAAYTLISFAKEERLTAENAKAAEMRPRGDGVMR
jgi:hypothetical protein